jgi:CRP-like cAMP-binding protein
MSKGSSGPQCRFLAVTLVGFARPGTPVYTHAIHEKEGMFVICSQTANDSTVKGALAMSDTAKLFADGLFMGLAPDEAAAFLRQCTEATYKDGSHLFMEQSGADKLYLILGGGIELRYEMPQRENADTIVASLKPGDAVGWSVIVPPYQYRLSGYCRGQTTLLEIDRGTLERLFETNYHLAYIFMRNIAMLTGQRLNQIQDKLAKVLASEAATGW